MASEIKSTPRDASADGLAPDFAERLEAALRTADRDRRLHQWKQRVRRLLPVCLLIGPIAGWRLTLASPGGPHVYVDAIAWLAFLLDVGVHANGAMLSYLGLQALPTIVGFLLFILVSVTLLGDDQSPDH